jgi:deazaflavin-dependent oxidoreductase (nitroreductase family)
MAGFDKATIETALAEREVELTTWGRKTGNPTRVIIWIWGDDRRLYIRSGGGMGRDWPQNLLANGKGILHLAGQDIAVRARHVTDPAEARAGAAMVNRKYATTNAPSAEGEPLTPAEQATFELTPDDASA